MKHYDARSYEFSSPHSPRESGWARLTPQAFNSKAQGREADAERTLGQPTMFRKTLPGFYNDVVRDPSGCRSLGVCGGVLLSNAGRHACLNDCNTLPGYGSEALSQGARLLAKLAYATLGFAVSRLRRGKYAGKSPT